MLGYMMNTIPQPARKLSGFERECDRLAVANGTPWTVLSNTTEEVLARFSEAVDASRWAMNWPGPTSILDVRRCVA